MKTLLFVPLLLLACGAPATKPADDRVADSLRTVAYRDSIRQDQLRDGPHTLQGPGGTRLEGDLRNGKRNGTWTSYGADGRIKSLNEYVDGVLQGPTTTFRGNGSIYYQGQYLNDRSFGEWRFFDEQGELVRTVVFDSTGAEVPK
ncbi:MAG: hypothetical protein QM724_02450 [Flavobacteriales bacterium]